MSLEQPLWLSPALGDPDIKYTGQQLRVMTDIMSFLAGVTLKNDLKVSQRGAGANLSVDVAAGSAVVPGTSVAYQGKYLVRSTAVVNVPLVGGVPGTGSRTDLIVALVQDNQADSSGFYAWSPVWVPGTTTAPANSIPLAKVTVSSGAVSITNSVISDSVRLLNTLGDVPLWQLTGGNGQALPHNTDTTYTGWTFSELIGVDTNGNAGEIVIRQSGRYSVTHSSRITLGGTTTTERAVYVEHLRGGTLLKRPASQSLIPGGVSSGGTALTATGTARCQPGDVLRARVYQNSGVQLNLADLYKDLEFAGYRIPGS